MTQADVQALSRAGEPTLTPLVRVRRVVLSQCCMVARMAHLRHPAADNICGSRWAQ